MHACYVLCIDDHDQCDGWIKQKQRTKKKKSNGKYKFRVINT